MVQIRTWVLAVLMAIGASAAIDRPTGAEGAQLVDAPALAARVQARYATINDFTASFVQTQTNPLLPKPVVERGTVKVKKPGRMRWIYTTGDRNEVVSDGSRIYSYFRPDRYVAVTAMPKAGEASTALLFLTGRGDLTRDFTAALASDQPSGEWRLELRPRVPQADFELLTLEVDRATLAFRGLIVRDPQGGTSAFRFNDLRENVGLPDRDFDFAIPRGVEVR
jgi:outer membrane lipoprotein carrier protein